jgi:glycosyltransferase domain-containing protein
MIDINITKKCAIIIPTMNKSSFIEDKLFYFNQINYKGTIHIADSSDNDHFDKSANFIIYFSLLGLKIIHHDTKGLNIEESKYFAVKNVTESYCQYCGDDDYILIDGLIKGIVFLEKNINYNSFTGNAISVNLSEWQNNNFSKYNLHGTEMLDLANRLQFYSNNYWPIWVLHRTKNYIKLLEETINYKTPLFREIFMGLKTLSQGLCKKIFCPYLIRGIHDNRFHFEELKNIILTPDFIKDKNLLITFLRNEINTFDKDLLIDKIIEKFTTPGKKKVNLMINQKISFLNKINEIFFYYSFTKNKYYKTARKLYLIKNL